MPRNMIAPWALSVFIFAGFTTGTPALSMCAMATAGAKRVKVNAASPSIVVHPSVQAVSEIGKALDRYWAPWYQKLNLDPKESKDPDIKVIQARRWEFNYAIKRAMGSIKEKTNSGRVLVLGATPEMDLGPLLDNFAEVDVADLSTAALMHTYRRYSDHKYLSGLKLHQTDLSGIPHRFQRQWLANRNGRNAMEETNYYFADFQTRERLEPLEFDSAAYDLVISLNTVESFPFGPVIAANKSLTCNKSQDLLSWLGYKFFSEPETKEAFRRILNHHGEEVRRLLKPEGSFLFGFSTQPRERLIRDSEAYSNLVVRMGDNSLSLAVWYRFDQPWLTGEVLGDRVIGSGLSPVQRLVLYRKK